MRLVVIRLIKEKKIMKEQTHKIIITPKAHDSSLYNESRCIVLHLAGSLSLFGPASLTLGRGFYYESNTIACGPQFSLSFTRNVRHTRDKTEPRIHGVLIVKIRLEFQNIPFPIGSIKFTCINFIKNTKTNFNQQRRYLFPIL